MTTRIDIAIVDGIGRPLTDSGFLRLADDALLTRQRTLPQVLTAALPITSDEAAIIAGPDELDPHLKVYRTTPRGRDLIFYGSVWVDEIGRSDEGVDMLVVTAMDQLAVLEKRYTDAQFPPTDLGMIVKQMVDATNTVDGETGIRTDAGWIIPSSIIDTDLRTNKPTILSMIGQFADQLDGIETWVEPIELDDRKCCELHAAPRRGADRPEVVFGYGDGTENNAIAMGRVRNKALVENDANGYSDTLVSRRQHAASIATIGRLVGYTSFTGETSQAVLDARTQARIDQRSTRDKVATYTATPSPDSAPILLDEFDVGDAVTLDYRKGSIAWRATPRVDSATLRILRGGGERLDAVTFRSIA